MIRADRFLNVPLALLPRETEKILRALEMRAEPPTPQGLVIESEDAAYRPYDLVDGVAIVPINGILVHGETFFSSWFGETGYDRIRAAFDLALNDAEAKAIALHVNSPGGEVAGCFDLAERIFQARDVKPICAILDESAYSAAYALACAAETVIVPRTGGTGSIGVVAMHMDITKALDEFGIKVTTFQYGARKTDSYPTTPMNDEARSRFQAEIDTLGEMFVDLVARNRQLSAEAVRNTEAACFLGDAGGVAGLADAVMSPQEAFAALLDEIA
jgi:signal peptide peptidase SppA